MPREGIDEIFKTISPAGERGPVVRRENRSRTIDCSSLANDGLSVRVQSEQARHEIQYSLRTGRPSTSDEVIAATTKWS